MSQVLHCFTPKDLYFKIFTEIRNKLPQLQFLLQSGRFLLPSTRLLRSSSQPDIFGFQDNSCQVLDIMLCFDLNVQWK